MVVGRTPAKDFLYLVEGKLNQMVAWQGEGSRKEATTRAGTGNDIFLLLRRLLLDPASLRLVQVERKALTHFLLYQASFKVCPLPKTSVLDPEEH